MSFAIVRQDLTKMKVDAIVNAANTELQMGGGVCGAIFKEAGVFELQTACKKLAPIQTGDAVITPGFGLPATFRECASMPEGWRCHYSIVIDLLSNSIKPSLRILDNSRDKEVR